MNKIHKTCIALLSVTFAAFVAVTFLTLGGSDFTQGLSVFLFILLPIALFVPFRNLLNKISINLSRKFSDNYKDRISDALYISLLPFTIGGVIAIIRMVQYSYLWNLMKNNFNFGSAAQLAQIHWTTIQYVLVVGSIISLFGLIIFFLSKRFAFGEGLKLTGVVFIFSLLSLAIMGSLMFVISFIIVLPISMIGVGLVGAP